jgi:predicted transporter
MKIRWILIIYAAISVLGLMMLLSRENVYVVLALVLGFLLLGHRELWSFVRYRRPPIIDERVRDNLTSAMKLTGVFFFIASIVLILMMRFNIFHDTPKELIVSGLLVIVGVVYLIGYHYYDRVRPNLGERATYWLRRCMITAGLSLSTIALAITLHNMVSAWFGFEEAFFFILGLLVAPAILIASLLGSMAVYIKGLWTSFKGIEPA